MFIALFGSRNEAHKWLAAIKRCSREHTVQLRASADMLRSEAKEHAERVRTLRTKLREAEAAEFWRRVPGWAGRKGKQR